jgi:tetratricopeptide (TPR) repeat protein
MGHALAGLLTLAGCAARAPVQAPATAPTQGAPRACEAQVEQVDDALVRLADRYLWDEVERLLQLALVTRRGLGQGCSEAARAALLKVARRWAEEGASSGGGQVYDLAQRAYLALATHFPGAQAELEHLFGRLEFTRAGRVGSELGEQTLTAERYAAAQRHHALALRGGGLTPEEARLSASQQLEASRRALDVPQPRWEPAPWLCEPDRTGACATRPRSPVVLPLAPTDVQMLAAYDLLLGEPAAASLPEAPEVVVDRAELLLRHGRLAEVEAALETVMIGRAGEPVAARAGLLLLRSLQVRWQDPAASPEAQASARARLIAVTGALRAAPARSSTTPASEALERALPGLRGAAMWQEAGAARAARRFGECATTFEAMAAEGQLGHDEAVLRFEAAACHEEGGAFGPAIAGYNDWLARFPGDRRTAEVELRLARTHEQVLNVEDARDHYIRFLALAPADPRAPLARRRSIALALVTGTVDEAQVMALARARRTGERDLAAAIRFRTEVRPGGSLARIDGYIQKFGRDGGEARLAIAHVRAAEALMRSSCPVGAIDGLCVEVTRDKTLGRVLPRDAKELAQARAQLAAAAALLATASASQGESEAPLAVTAGELASARRVLSLLLGDLRAEAALSTRPPASYDPVRSQVWLSRRTAEVQQMQAVYESVNPAAGRPVAQDVAGAESTASDRFAAVIEARKAQVYEADIGLLEEVAAAVLGKSIYGQEGVELAARMQALANERRGEVFKAYHRCIALVGLWGQDPDGRAETCRAGLGRLVQRYELRIEYAPDLLGRLR